MADIKDSDETNTENPKTEISYSEYAERMRAVEGDIAPIMDKALARDDLDVDALHRILNVLKDIDSHYLVKKDLEDQDTRQPNHWGIALTAILSSIIKDYNFIPVLKSALNGVKALNNLQSDAASNDRFTTILLFYCGVRADTPERFQESNNPNGPFVQNNDWPQIFAELRKLIINDRFGVIFRLRSILFFFRRFEVYESRAKRKEVSLPNNILEAAYRLYALAVEYLLPRVAHVHQNLTSRKELKQITQLCHDAVIRAIKRNYLGKAVELFEEGMSIFWGQALRLRSDELDLLPEHERIRLLSYFESLEKAEGRPFAMVAATLEATPDDKTSDEARKLIKDIQRRPGFERFLKIKRFNELALVALNGPVVILVANRHDAYAMIIQYSEDAGTTDVKTVNLTQNRQSLLEDISELINDASWQFTGEEVFENEDAIAGSLENQWNWIVEPVLEELKLREGEEDLPSRDRTRIQWYPSGDFTRLPLHAAALKRIINHAGGGETNFSKVAISTYVPSLTALLRARNNLRRLGNLTSEQLKVLLVAEAHPQTDGNYIGSALAEVQEAASRVRGAGASALVLAGEKRSTGESGGPVPLGVRAANPTSDAILFALPSAHIFHIATHGIQKHDSPLKSEFQLTNGDSLTISSLITAKLPNAVLAILSACQTAEGSKHYPDHNIHLARAMVFCGFCGVVATKWSATESYGSSIMIKIYKELFPEPEHGEQLSPITINLSDIPYILDEKIREFHDTRCNPEDPNSGVGLWGPYIYLGL